MTRKRKKSKHSGSSTLIIILLLVMIGGGLSGLFLWERNQNQQEAVAAQDEPYEGGPVTVEYNNETYQLRDDLDYFLFMGLDKTTDTVIDPAYRVNTQQADFLLLMVVDHTNKRYYGVHVNRDTMAEIPKLDSVGAISDTYVAQICLAHAYGSGGKDSCRNQVWAVSRYFYDLPIKHYVAITMDGIPVLNDAVGGVVVHVTDDFSKVDPSLVMGQDVRLWGEHALHYVRNRFYVADETNLNRMNRQREYLNSLYMQMRSAMSQDERFSLRLVNMLSDYITSDLTTDEMSSFYQKLQDYQYVGIQTIDGEAVLGNGYMEFYTDEDSFRDLVIKLFYRRTQ